MTYLEEFRKLLSTRDFAKCLQLWQEYCHSDTVDPEEIIQVLKAFQESEHAIQIGRHIESVLPLIMIIDDQKAQEVALEYVYNLQLTNSDMLRTFAADYFKDRFSTLPHFNDKIRLVGLRSKDNFHGAVSSFLLLNHIHKKNYVLHEAGWGVGEIIDVSFLREQLVIEFENLRGGKKDIPFKSAFKSLKPLEKKSFLARRFYEPDILEKEAKKDPVAIIAQLLRELGPKSAQEIKDLFVDYIIPEKEYAKWWQQARTKVKKDPLIESPDTLKGAFKTRKTQASVDDRLQKAFVGKHTFSQILNAAYSLVKDFPEVIKDPATKEIIAQKIKSLLLSDELSLSEHLQALLFLESSLQDKGQKDEIYKCLKRVKNLEKLINEVEILALKKRILVILQELFDGWISMYLEILFKVDQNQLRDFIVKELMSQGAEKELQKQFQYLLEHPQKYPEAVVWNFQKILSNDSPFFSDSKSRFLFFESFLILFGYLDNRPEYKDLARKIYNILTQKRFEVVRDFLKIADEQFAQEFLLLATKCRGFTDHDQKILRSLVEVVHPSLIKEKHHSSDDYEVIWTTQQGYMMCQEKINHIGTVELVHNAKEIEEARSHGDLRENAPYKAALERRDRLQQELKKLSEEFHRAQIISDEDIPNDRVGVGITVDLESAKGVKITYTVLGPWDADPEKNILSFHSKFVQSMLGKKIGQKFTFRDDEYTVLHLKPYGK